MSWFLVCLAIIQFVVLLLYIWCLTRRLDTQLKVRRQWEIFFSVFLRVNTSKVSELHNITVALMLLPGACQNTSCLQAFIQQGSSCVISAACKPAWNYLVWPLLVEVILTSCLEGSRPQNQWNKWVGWFKEIILTEPAVEDVLEATRRLAGSRCNMEAAMVNWQWLNFALLVTLKKAIKKITHSIILGTRAKAQNLVAKHCIILVGTLSDTTKDAVIVVFKWQCI